MIKSFRQAGLEGYFRRSDQRGIPAQSANRMHRMLDVLDAALRPEDMNVPGYKFHQLKGQRAGTCATSVTGNLRITFRFDGEGATDVDIEDYH